MESALRIEENRAKEAHLGYTVAKQTETGFPGDFMNSRRSFFQDIALLSALAGIAEQEGYAQAKDEKVSNFWDAYFDEAERDPNQISRGSNDGDLMDPSKKVQLIHATDAGLVYPDTIDVKQLMA